MGILDVTKEQLRQLDGDSLRELVALLCEAEIQKAGMPVSAVRWGGAHTAADGGLDVEVDLDNRLFHGDFLPRNLTGFQVKKSSMPPSLIPGEMSPKGKLRPIFRKLARRDGCYVIVSVADDPTGSRLIERLDAMQTQLATIENQANLHLDFYGRGRLSQWLRRHPGVQLWIYERLGIPLHGWKPFGRWTYVPPGDDDCYSARSFDADRHANPLRSMILGVKFACRITLCGGSTANAALYVHCIMLANPALESPIHRNVDPTG